MIIILVIKLINTVLIINYPMLDVKKLLRIMKIPSAMIFLISQGVFISEVYAYVDPGTGSIIFQAIIGALIGVGIGIKVYWEKIKFKLGTKFVPKKSDA